MRKELLPQWREDIVGEWQAELAGVDLLYLEPVGTRFAFRLVLLEDGTADWDFTIPNPSPMAPQPTPPFPHPLGAIRRSNSFHLAADRSDARLGHAGLVSPADKLRRANGR
ncbi:MAG TPA: hypothetical protein VGY66_30115 [Gemmataceae bacterium]|jgi:hypothetical protein|nr:hypothetical protein [Gemmataceae bacterium]